MKNRITALFVASALFTSACQPEADTAGTETNGMESGMESGMQSVTSASNAGSASSQNMEHPDLNGIWQAMNSANWNLEAHSAEGLDAFWQMGAIAAIPAGKSVLQGGGDIPYLPEALAQRDANGASWPQADPEAKCYMLGVPRVTYHDMPFQIFQSEGDDILMVYPFAATNRVIHMGETDGLPIDSWMGRSNGRWDGDVLEVTTLNQNGESWLDRAGNHASNQLVVTERFSLIDEDHLWYEATLTDPSVFSEPWTIEMPLYRHVEEDAQLLEHKCVPFADMLLYSDLLMPEDQGTPD